MVEFIVSAQNIRCENYVDVYLCHWCLQSWLRVSQLYHTLSQVVVGAVLGSIFSILWYLSWDAVVLKAFNSSFWVQAIVILGAAGFCLGFLVYVVRYWFNDEDEDEVSN